MSDEFKRDDRGVVLLDTLRKIRKMVDGAGGDTADKQLANMMALIVASTGLDAERARAAFDAAMTEQPRIAALIERAKVQKYN